MDQPTKNRFFKKVPKQPNKKGCLVWLGGKHQNGSGRFWIGTKAYTAHRLAWELKHGAVPPLSKLYHHYGELSCVQTDHLFFIAAGQAPPIHIIKNRFLKHIPDKQNENGCLEWIGSRTKGGYGTFYLGGGRAHPFTTTAHRVAWMLDHGPIPVGYSVLHYCDNPPCVQISHLFLGNQTDNIADARAKGRLATGARHGLHKHPEAAARGARHGSATHPERVARGAQSGTAKLTDTDVMEIRRSWRYLSRKQLAGKYGVCKGLIHVILSGKGWTHLPKGDYDARTAYRLARHRHADLKLTPEKVRKIQQRFRVGSITKTALAKKYGVTCSAISCVISGKTWKHIPLGD